MTAAAPLSTEAPARAYHVRRAVCQVSKRPPPPPLARVLTFIQHRDPITGRFAPRPPAPPVGVLAAHRIRVRPLRAAECQVIRHVIHYGGGESEVIEVRVKSTSARVARLAGELTAQALRDFEAELSLGRLEEINPARAHEWHLEQMHHSHRSAKGKRAAVSRVRNEDARAKAEAKGQRRPRTKGKS